MREATKTWTIQCGGSNKDATQQKDRMINVLVFSA